jgi:PBP1b-binding outer membrane lipoprotein LpoB
MKTKILTLLMFLIVVLTIISCKKDNDGTDPIVVGPGNAGLLIINHENTNLVSIPENWIDSAKQNYIFSMPILRTGAS